ncbi:MAG: DUF192 domain-containing protein [Capsulimonadaceae bacterium]|nr:DUF192 domain-containing protein [Capsulimonadaceae bacterium]
MATKDTATTYLLVHGPSGTVVADRVTLASTWWQRGWGLIGSPALNAGEGLWLRGVRSVHTMGMRYAIDLLFLDRAGRCQGVCQGVRPGRLVAGPPGTTDTIELAEGTVGRSGLFESMETFELCAKSFEE